MLLMFRDVKAALLLRAAGIKGMSETLILGGAKWSITGMSFSILSVMVK